MKKNKEKSAYWYKDNIKKYRWGFLIFNFLLFTLVFLVFTAVLKIFVEERFIYNVKNEIMKFDNDIDIVANDSTEYIGFTNIEDPRITAVYYYTDPKISSPDQFVSPVIIGSVVNGSLGYEDITPINQIKQEKIGEYKKEKILGYNFMTYVVNKRYKAVESPTSPRDRLVCYVKIYMNIDGELTAKNELNIVFMICTFGFLLLSYLSSYIIMKRSTKPIQQFVDKQITFVSDASHELRTPIAIVTSQIENILANPDQSVYDVSEDLAVSLKELTRLKKLVADLLSLARSDQNRLTYHFEVTNLNIMLNEVVDPFIEIASFEDRKLEYIGEDVECNIDKDKTRELMIILLDNALKYTNPGDSITVTLKQEGNEVIIEVADTGIGISEETKEKIFERFYREDKTRSRETGGNGLGLSIAKTIVHDMDGKITVDHNEPKGTKFIITLHRAKQKNKVETE